MITTKLVLSFAIVVLFDLKGALGHGFLDEPVSRSSAWTKDEFKGRVPINYNHMELFCGGGFTHDPEFGMTCGVCGDDLSTAAPRPNENGGKYSRTVDGKVYITRQYTQGQEVHLRFILTANHMGYAEFSVCPLENDSAVETEECFKKYPLQVKYVPEPGDICTNQPHNNKIVVCKGKNTYNLKALLPQDLSCDHCVLRWHYRTGNSWGTCPPPEGGGRIGCGPQEIFRGCSDIKITKK